MEIEGGLLFFLFSSNLVLSWRHLVPLELNFILNLELSESESENEVAQSCLTLCGPMDSSLHRAPPSMGFSRQEYWSGLSFPSPGNLPNPGIEPRSLTL